MQLQFLFAGRNSAQVFCERLCVCLCTLARVRCNPARTTFHHTLCSTCYRSRVWLAVAQIWKVRRCVRRNVDRGAPRNCLVNSTSKRACLSTDDEGVPRSTVLVDSPSLSSVASERGVLGLCALSLFDLLISGGEDAASLSGRTSCARDSLASSAVSDGSEEEVVRFDNLPGEPWKVSLPLIALSRRGGPSISARTTSASVHVHDGGNWLSGQSLVEFGKSNQGYCKGTLQVLPHWSGPQKHRKDHSLVHAPIHTPNTCT